MLYLPAPPLHHPQHSLLSEVVMRMVQGRRRRRMRLHVNLTHKDEKRNVAGVENIAANVKILTAHPEVISLSNKILFLFQKSPSTPNS